MLLSVARDAAPFEPAEPPYPVYQLAARGAIGPAGDNDFYCLGRLEAGDVLSAAICGFSSARGTLRDAVIDVLRSGGSPSAPVLVASDDDGGTGNDAYVYRFAVPVDDTYFVACRSGSAARAGTYELAAWLENGPATPAPTPSAAAGGAAPPEAEPNDAAPDASDLSRAWRPVTHVSANAGTLTAAGEAAADEYAVELRPGDLLSVAARPASEAEPDLAVRLVDPSGATVALDLDSVHGTIGNAADADVIACPVTAGGAYSVRVWDKSAGGGAYRLDLSLSRPPDLPPAEVVARHLFYNHSVFDHYSAGASADDDAAVAIDKLALMPGQPASLGNVTSYSRGINGVMIDVKGLSSGPDAGDFVFDVSIPDAPGAWETAPAPSEISRRAGAGAGGSDRVSLVWPDGAIIDRWLRVTFRASPANGLAADDVFLFGNVAGESGDDAGAAAVGMADVLRTRARQRAVADLTEWCDFNRDGRVNAVDVAVARARVGHRLFMPAERISSPGVQETVGRPRSPVSRRLWYEFDR